MSYRPILLLTKDQVMAKNTTAVAGVAFGPPTCTFRVIAAAEESLLIFSRLLVTPRIKMMRFLRGYRLRGLDGEKHIDNCVDTC